MSHKIAKKVRREVKKIAREDYVYYVSTLYWLKRLPLGERLGIAYKIVKGVSNHGRSK